MLAIRGCACAADMSDSMEHYVRRWRRAQDAMRRDGIDALILAPSADLYYMSGYAAKPTERFTGFVLPATGDPSLVTPAFELARLDAQFQAAVACRTWAETDDPLRLTAEIVRAQTGRAQTRRLSVAAANQMWSEFLLGLQTEMPDAAWSPASRVISPLRMVKDDTERRLLAEAQVLAENSLRRLIEAGFAGKTERAVAAALLEARRAVGLDPTGSAGIIGSGPNGASPHHMNSDRVIARGDAIVIDFGGGHHGYRADITRTIHVGPARDDFKRVYDTVLAANAAAFEATRPGATCASIDAAGRVVIDRAGYRAYFTHRLGHGIGLDGHEPPYMIGGNALPLAANMTFTDEPGVYLPGQFGVRIEDVVAVTATGAKRLTSFPRELMIVD
jgi:Xaa-Pro aminopeptidase